MTDDHIFHGLNERQAEAVRHVKGPLLVVAGAGSGKTKVLTHRVAYLMERGIQPRNILAVTFTNKATGEMKSRVENLLGKKQGIPFIGTFHAFGVRILREDGESAGYDKNFVIFDSSDTESLMRQILKDKNIDTKKFTPKGILAHISSAKNAFLTPDEYASTATNTYEEVSARMYHEYQSRLRSSNGVDFDDLLALPVRMMQENSGILEKYQERFQFISIDEYQDTNHAQYLLATLLSEKYRNICAIGDSDQAIYSFRGANIQNILDFEKSYPDAKIIKLEQNYRSTQNILDGADGVIDHNISRVKKKMFTERGSGELIEIHETYDEREEGEIIFRSIEKLMREKSYKRNDFVVLYRTNAQSRVLEEAALRHAIPYQIIGGVKFYSRAEIKDVIAYLRFVVNPADTVSFERIVNKPSRRIGDATIVKVLNSSRERNLPVGVLLDHVEMSEGLADAAKRALTSFQSIIRKLRLLRESASAGDFIEKVLQESGFEAYLRDGTSEGENRWENVLELISVARKYDHVPPEDSIPLFLEEVALVSDVDSLEEERDTVTLMTLHSAKGLEFPVVFIAGLEENLFPHSRSLFSPDDLEEERRLMYVGMTRAKELLFLIFTTQRLIYGSFSDNLPSRFLREIPSEALNKDLLPRFLRGQEGKEEAGELIYTPYEEEWTPQEFSPGDRVEHPKFGEGSVVEIEGDIITIEFGIGKAKRFALSIAPLRKIQS